MRYSDFFFTIFVDVAVSLEDQDIKCSKCENQCTCEKLYIYLREKPLYYLKNEHYAEWYATDNGREEYNKYCYDHHKNIVEYIKNKFKHAKTIKFRLHYPTFLRRFPNKKLYLKK